MEVKGLGAQPCGEGRGQYFALLSASGSASAITSERDASTVWHAYSPGPPLIAQLWCRQSRAFGLATACGRRQRTVQVEGQLAQRA
jgi:hypothetical protein